MKDGNDSGSRTWCLEFGIRVYCLGCRTLRSELGRVSTDVWAGKISDKSTMNFIERCVAIFTARCAANRQGFIALNFIHTSDGARSENTERQPL